MKLGKAACLAALMISSLPSPILPQSSSETAEFSFEARRLAGLRAEISALMLHGVAGGDLPMAALAWPDIESLGQEGGLRVRLLVELEGLALIESSEGQTSRSIEVHAYAVADESSVAGYLSQVIRIELDIWRERLAGGGLRWSDSFELPAGEYSLRILAIDRESGRHGLRFLPLSLQAAGDPQSTLEPVLWGPFARDSPEPWLLVRGANEDEPAAELPAAMPVAQTGEIVEVAIWGSLLPSSLDLRAEVSPIGSPRRGTALETSLVDRQPMAIAEMEKLVVRATLPDLETGSYRLTFSARRRGRNPAVGLDLFVLDGVPISGPLVWCRLRAASQGVSVAEAEIEVRDDTQEAGKRRLSALRREAREGYLAALRQLSSGSRKAAVDRLIGLQFELAIGEEQIQALHEVELDIAQSLSEPQQEVLLPLCLLHLDAYREHVRRREFPPAILSRRVIVDLAAFWIDLDESETGRRQAADVLVGLSLELMRANFHQAGREVLRQAMESHPGHEVAGLQLAYSYERSALYHEAVSALKLLVDANPKQAEARLRMAVNLTRDHQPAKARAIYRRLLAEHNPAWILTIAYEELARLDLAAGPSEEVISLLSTAISRLPEQQGLHLLLAHVLDRLQRPADAYELLRSMPRGAGSSPRSRYSQPPQPDVYHSLLLSSKARLGFLARALEAGGDGDNGR